MNPHVIYGVRLVFHSTAWIGTTEDFYDKILGGENFSTHDINLAHEFMQWMNTGNKVFERPELMCIVEELANDFYF